VAKVKSERASARVISWFETSRKGSTSDHGPVSFGFSGLSGADPTGLAYSTRAGGSSANPRSEIPPQKVLDREDMRISVSLYAGRFLVGDMGAFAPEIL